MLVSAGLASLRRGQLPDLSARHARLRSALMSNWAAPVVGTLGDRVASSPDLHPAKVLLIWTLCRLRPDGKPDLNGIDEHAWLQSTSWRPFLAVAAHNGLLAVPAFPTRYRRRDGEAAIENLCGLWSVGHSTVYRYLEKGRRQLADLLGTPAERGRAILSLRNHAHRSLALADPPADGWPAWHRAQARTAFVDRRVLDGLWHTYKAGDVSALLESVQHYGTEAAGTSEADALLADLEANPSLTFMQRFDLQQRWALLWRYRHDAAREEEALRRAIRLANEEQQPLFIGMALAAIARFHELRDRDRAFASYEEALDHLRQALTVDPGDLRTRALHEHAASLVRMAWLHLRRNNPRARALLDQVAQIEAQASLPSEIAAPLEQTWGEYWRCVGDSGKALEHKHRALALYERLGDQRAVLNTYRNLSLIYGEASNFERAIDYGERVVYAARNIVVEPEILAGAHGNLGIAHFYRGDVDRAITEYGKALEIEQRAGLRTHLSASHYNLAEAHYKRFQACRDPLDEAAGDRHAAEAARLSAEDNLPGLNESARALKQEILGAGPSPDRLLPSEHASHIAEMGEIDRLRASLGLPNPAEKEVGIRLAIAQAYIAIAVKERETALSIASRHGVDPGRFQAELDHIRSTFLRETSREQQLEADWHKRGGDLLGKERRKMVLSHLLSHGSINKSAYAETAAVSLATASKHLGLLTERGLLVQTGKGPSTRYLVPTT